MPRTQQEGEQHHSYSEKVGTEMGGGLCRHSAVWEHLQPCVLVTEVRLQPGLSYQCR